MDGDITIDVGSAIPYAVDRILSIFGKDSITQALKEKLNKQIKTATHEASWVQCVGMYRPIPITDIYQPTRLTRLVGTHKKGSFVSTDFWTLLEKRSDAIIYAGPGQGKTTLLHWMYMNLLRSKEWIPVLFTLRWPRAIEDLTEFINEVTSSKSHSRLRQSRLALLIDGYDEISSEERKEVSAALREFNSLELGNFYLTCRTFYDVIDLVAPHYFIDTFNRDDALGYVQGFSKTYNAKINAVELLNEMEAHGFEDFAARPLMLALVCILKSGPMPQLPRNTIGLIRRAVDTLTFRWDESKGLSREPKVNLDGDERVRCLMRVAHNMNAFYEPESHVQAQVATHLKLIQRKDVDPQKLLTEIAQWYGIFVPVMESYWSFVHRTMHDYLAARYWVESGTFNPSRITKWDARAAYAACLVPDATQSLEQALKISHDVYAFTECLYNNAYFDPDKVAVAVLMHFSKYQVFDYESTNNSLSVGTDQDFFHMVSNDLLASLLVASLRGVRKTSHNLVLAFTLDEVRQRGNKISTVVMKQIKQLFPLPNFTFHVQRMKGLSRFNLSSLST